MFKWEKWKFPGNKLKEGWIKKGDLLGNLLILLEKWGQKG